MGSCCEAQNSDCDVINGSYNKNSTYRKEKINSINKISKNEINNCSDDHRKTNNDTNQQITPNINAFSLFNFNSKKKLKLIIKQSKCLQEGKEFLITPAGLIGNPNNNQDGSTIFGDYNVSIYIIFKIKNIQPNNRVDFIFPKEESNTEQNHAEIKYDKKLDLFQVKSLKGNGCFLRIDQKIVSIFIIYILIYLVIKK